MKTFIQVFIALAWLHQAMAQVQNVTAATMSMKLGLLKETKEVWANFILNQLNNYAVKDMKFEQGHVQENTFHIDKLPNETFLYENTHFESLPENNSFEVSIHGLQVGFTSQQFKFKGSFISLKGAAVVSIPDVRVNTTFKSQYQTLGDGRKVPGFIVTDFKMDVPENKSSVVIHGNIETKVSAAFKKVFMGKLLSQIEKDLKVTLQTRLVPNINRLFAQERGYLEVMPGIMFDTSLQDSPHLYKHYVGFEMTGLFSPANSTDLEPENLERNTTDNSLLYPKFPEFDRNGSKLQLNIHQMAIDSILLSYLKKNSFNTWMLSDSFHGTAFNLTSTGLNKIFTVDTPNPAKNASQPVKLASNKSKAAPGNQPKNAPKPVEHKEKPNGFVAQYGADKPVDIKFGIESVHNLRIKKDNETMRVKADISMEFWVNNGTSYEAIDLTVKNCWFFLKIIQNPENNRVLQSEIVAFELGDISIDSSSLVNGSGVIPNTTNFGLNMHKVREYLDNIKPITILSLNKFLQTQLYSLPPFMFYGIFEVDMEKVFLKYHDSYIGININPIVKKIHYDETSEPRFIYQQFMGVSAPDLEDQNFVFLETCSATGEVHQKRIREFSLLESFSNQIQIFGEVPPIQN